MYNIFKFTNNIKFKVKTVQKLLDVYNYLESEEYFFIDRISIEDANKVVLIDAKKIEDFDLQYYNIDLLFKDTSNYIKSGLLKFSLENQYFNLIGYGNLKSELSIDKKSIQIEEIKFDHKKFKTTVLFSRFSENNRHTQEFEFGDFEVYMSSKEFKKCILRMLKYLNEGQ